MNDINYEQNRDNFVDRMLRFGCGTFEIFSIYMGTGRSVW